MELNGRVALVTGASRGIGAAIAERLAASGASVAVGYGSDRSAAEELVEKIDGLAVAVGGDLEDPASSEEMVESVEGSLGPIDVLVSNAGIAPQQDLQEITVEDWDQVINANLRPAF